MVETEQATEEGKKRAAKLEKMVEAMSRHVPAQLEAGRKHREECEARYADPDRFLVTSHTDWAKHAERADIARIETIWGSDFALSDLHDAIDAKEHGATRIASAERKAHKRAIELETERGRGMVWRTDFAAGDTVKHQCATGGVHADIAGEKARTCAPFLLSLRICDLSMLWPRARVNVFLRPYMAPIIKGGWPLEVRVWVLEGKVRAVSSYYPQRTLAPSQEFDTLVNESIDATERLAQVCQPFDPIPHERETPEAVTFTADFIATKKHGTLWLESGPYTYPNGGAHPCCFENPAELLVPSDTISIARKANARYRQRPSRKRISETIST